MAQDTGSVFQNTKKAVIPLIQTVFLSKNMMGVKEIDQVKARIFLEDMVLHSDSTWLNGVYEIDLEYYGLEGTKLYKNTISLPLKAELPSWWQEREKSRIQLTMEDAAVEVLAPYVLEFSGNIVATISAEEIAIQKDDTVQFADTELSELDDFEPTLEQPAETVVDSEIEAEVAAVMADELKENIVETINSSEENDMVAREELAESVWSEIVPAKKTVVSEQIEDGIQIAMEEASCSEAPPPELQQIQTELNNELDVEIPYAFRNRRDQQEAEEREAQKLSVSLQEVEKTEQVVPSVKSEEFSSEDTVAVINEEILKEPLKSEPVIAEESKGVTVEAAKKQEPLAKKTVPEPDLRELKLGALGKLRHLWRPYSVKEESVVVSTSSPQSIAKPETDIKPKHDIDLEKLKASALQKIKQEQDNPGLAVLVEKEKVSASSISHTEKQIEENNVVESDQAMDLSGATLSNLLFEETEPVVKELEEQEDTMVEPVINGEELDESIMEVEPVMAEPVSEQLAAADAILSEAIVDATAKEDLEEVTVVTAETAGVDSDVAMMKARIVMSEKHPIPPLNPCNEGACTSYRLRFYLVQDGEDLAAVAEKHQLSKEALKSANPILEEEVRTGMVLSIPC